MPKDYVSGLEDRLKVVERMMERHDNLLTGHLAACGRPRSIDTGRSIPDLPSRDGGIRLDASRLEDGDADAPTDGMGITFVDERSSAFFGESSNITFVRHLLRAAENTKHEDSGRKISSVHDDPQTEHHVMEVAGELSPLTCEIDQRLDASATVLPSADEMEQLMSVYFDIYGLLFPFLHEPTFMQIYNDFKASGFRKVSRTWLGVLNMIFAMASNIDRKTTPSAKERFEKAHTFYSRAIALCSAASRRTVTLDIVHYLLLVVLYLQGTQRSIQTWSIHGLLVRTAIALGLHCDYAAQRVSPIQQEIRRRTWHTMYCLDKVLSVTFGRPGAITEDLMRIPLPMSWPATPNAASSPGTKQDIADFLGYSVRLYQIMGKSVAQQYNNNIGASGFEMDELTSIQVAGEIRAELRRWLSDLPESLSICEVDSPELIQTSKQNKLRTILTLRYHNMNILIHRPLLSAVLRYLAAIDPKSAEPLPYKAQLSMAEANECIASSQSTISIIHHVLTNVESKDNNLGVWFFTLYYCKYPTLAPEKQTLADSRPVFTATMMLCSHMLWAQHGGVHNGQAIIATDCGFMKKAIEALRKLDDKNPLVQLCLKYIEFFRDSQYPKGKLRVATNCSC